MPGKFELFTKKHNKRINDVADAIATFQIDAKTIGIKEAKSRVIGWLGNFEQCGWKDFELPLYLLERIDFIKLDELADKLIKDADKEILNPTSYIAPLGEHNESSFKISAKLHRNERFKPSLTLLLNQVGQSKFQLLLFDDFLNSGGQLVSIFYALLGQDLPNGEINDEADKRSRLNAREIKALRNAEIHLFYYQGFEEGLEKVETRLRNELDLNVKVHCHYYTNNNDGAFGDAGEEEKVELGASGTLGAHTGFKGKKYTEVSEFYHLAKEVGEKLLRVAEPNWATKKYLDRALGYGNLSRIIVTDSNIPTITLTALWQTGTITIGENTFLWKNLLPRTKKVLTDPASILTSVKLIDDFQAVDAINEKLQDLYETDQIPEGLELVEEAFARYELNYRLLRHLIRFNLRRKNWFKVRKELEILDQKNLNDDIIGLCKLALFEVELREANDLYDEKQPVYIEKILHAQKFLNEVPVSQRSHELFPYWNGRWYLTIWFASSKRQLSNLTLAQDCFKNAMQLQKRWWTECYLCIVLKLLKKEDFKSAASAFSKTTEQLMQKTSGQSSVRTYRATSFLLNDDLTGLMKFMHDHRAPAATDFQSTINQHLSLIFYNDENKYRQYRDLIDNWTTNSN